VELRVGPQQQRVRFKENQIEVLRAGTQPARRTAIIWSVAVAVIVRAEVVRAGRFLNVLRTFSGGQFPGTPGELSPIAKCSNRGCTTSVTNCGDFGENLFSNPAVGRAPTATTNQNKNE
jgi:hypothetical protein